MSLGALDDDLETLLASLWTQERKARTILAITSDHGEGLGDHNAKFHSSDLYNSQTRVPLLFAGPGIKSAKIHQPVGLVSIAPTLLELAGFVPPGMPQMDGTSLAPLLLGAEQPSRDAGEALSVMVKDRSVKTAMRALVSGRYKLIKTDGDENIEVYDMITDPGEKTNLASKRPELVQELERKLQARDERDSISPF